MADSQLSRRTSRWVIALFLGAQLLIPLRYYWGDDDFDERFSWRMFSAIRVVQCRTHLLETPEEGTPTTPSLNRILQTAWVTQLRRNRERVIEAVLERRCNEEGMREVVLTNECIDATGRPMPARRWSRNCQTGEVSEPLKGAGDDE